MAFSRDTSSAICTECEQPATTVRLSRAGSNLCPECVSAYYVVCARCGGLVARDESLSRENLVYCSDCFSKPAGDHAAADVDETLIEGLIAEYVSLHAEEKKISDRMEVIKEQLKLAAASKQRAGNAVVLRAGDAAIRCSYRTSLKCEPEAAKALVQLLGEEEFSALFERKTTFTPVKNRIAEFLAGVDESRQELRDTLRAALQETETVILSVVTSRK